MLTTLRWTASGLEPVHLLGRCRALQTTRLRLLLTALLGLSAGALLLLFAAQAWLEYPPVRYIALAIAGLSLASSAVLVRWDRVRAASAALLWGVTLAVSAQALVAGGLHNPGLFAYPVLLAAAAGLLGGAQARALLGLMLAVLALLALPVGPVEVWGWQPVEPAPPAMRAAVMGVFLLLAFVGLRQFQRSRLRDVQAIDSLNQSLASALAELRAREAELTRTRQQLEALHQVLERRGADSVPGPPADNRR